LEWLVFTEACSALGLALANCGYFLEYARQARTAPRRVGSLALALIHAAFGLEAALFLGEAQLSSAARSALLLAVRSALFLATGLVSVLIWRSRYLKRR
jgi:hypothetical protein